MKTAEQVNHARERLIERVTTTEGLSDQQKTLIAGMSVALCWVMEVYIPPGEGDTMNRMLSDEPIAAGRTIPMFEFLPSKKKGK